MANLIKLGGVRCSTSSSTLYFVWFLSSPLVQFVRAYEICSWRHLEINTIFWRRSYVLPFGTGWLQSDMVWLQRLRWQRTQMSFNVHSPNKCWRNCVKKNINLRARFLFALCFFLLFLSFYSFLSLHGAQGTGHSEEWRKEKKRKLKLIIKKTWCV